MKQQFLKDTAGTIRLTVFHKNRALIPSAATVALYKENGTSVLQAPTTATISSTTGEMTYALTATHTANLGSNFKATWTYTVGPTTYQETQLFDVVRSILSIPITDDDLYKEMPSLMESNFQQSGTAQSGVLSSITDTKRKELDDYWKGGTIEILAGTGEGQKRLITGSVQASGIISVSPNFVTPPDTTSTYRIIRSWYSMIEHCFDIFEQMLYNMGNRSALILESSQIKIPLIYLTMKTISSDLRDEEGDKWDTAYKRYEAEFEKAFQNMKLDYDKDESGGVQGQEKQSSINQFNVFRS